jgi:pentatricopeptide repeat protein
MAKLLQKLNRKNLLSSTTNGTFVSNLMTETYGKPSHESEHLHSNFNANTNPDGFSESIKLLSKQGQLKDALHILHLMNRRGLQPDSSTYAALLQGCIDIGTLSEGKLVHGHIILTGFFSNAYLGTKILIMYAKCSSLEDARKVFDEMSDRNVVSWNAMITAYSRRGFPEQALALLSQMRAGVGVWPDEFTFASILPACAASGGLRHGREVHEDVIRSGFQSDTFVGNALVDMYAKCRSVEDAHKVFEKMTELDVVSWSAMIAGYAQNEYGNKALKVFRQMQSMAMEPNAVTYVGVLPACADSESLGCGREVHEDIVRRGFESVVVVCNALIDMYVKCRSMDKAWKVFDKMPERDVVSWTSLISGYAQNGCLDMAVKLFAKMPERNVVSWTAMIAGCAQNGCFDEALRIWHQMRVRGMQPNSDTFASILPACAGLGTLHKGREIHEDIIRSGFQYNVFVGNTLVDMYAKCGCIEDAQKVFENMPIRDVVSWNEMIVGCAMHGFCKEILQLFERMQYSGTKPNHVTFVGILSACCHAGMVDDGCQYFDCMNRDWNLIPAEEHYCCLVDLLGRAGRLNEAQDLINKMPMKPGAAVWRSLLGACRIHNNIELGEHASRHLFELDPKNAAHYVLLSNIFAAAGRWDEVEKVRKMMKDRRVEKMPGRSWIEVNNKVYDFFVGDKSHPQMRAIYAMLEKLSGQMKQVGYVPERNFVLHDVEDEQKEHILCHHSEKLAIVFGLINTPPGTPIRVVKNLRICGDCHSATKFISRIVVREIVVRDAIRFHHFKEGQCSCGDYW